MPLPALRSAEVEHIIGVVASVMASENTMAIESVTANSRKIRPTTIRYISRMGMNTAFKERLIEMTVGPISFAPRNAAAIGDRPISRMARNIFDHHDCIVHQEAGCDGEGH